MRSLPVGAISDLIADCPAELLGMEFVIYNIPNNKIRRIDSSLSVI